ncbi:MAG: sigma-E factor negative regulatory protein [Gammaproteobacteria bacterium]
MTERLRAQISALTDDELPSGEHELLLRRFAVEKYVCRCWERYHLIGEAMRKNLPAADTRGFVDRVMRALEPVPIPVRHRISSRLGQAAAGVAIAACVAVGAIGGLRYHSLHQQAFAQPANVVPVAAALPSSLAVYGSVRNAEWNGTSPEVRAELGNYVISHAEAGSALGQQNMLPYFFVSSFESHAAPARTPPNSPRP